MAELLDNQNEQGDPPLPSGYVAIKKQSQGAPPLPSGYVVKKKESSGSTSQKGAVVSPTKTTTTSTSSDTEPPKKAQASVALGGQTGSPFQSIDPFGGKGAVGAIISEQQKTATLPTKKAEDDTTYSYPLRKKLYPGEDKFFKENPNVGGMAAEDQSVILNPYSSLNDKEKQSIIINETARLAMRGGYERPTFELTPEQKQSFKNYSSNIQDQRETIVGRILSGDPSAGNVTPEQKKYAEGLRSVMNLNNGFKSIDPFGGKSPVQAIVSAQQKTIKEAAPAVTKQAEPPKEEDYFTGGFGNFLRGVDEIAPIGIGDFIDDMARSVSSGYRQGTLAEAADKLLLKGHKATPEQIQKFIDANKDSQQMKPSDEMQNYTKIYEEEGKGFWGVVKGIFKNPTVVPELITSSLVGMATNKDALLAGASVIGSGAAIGATTGASGGTVVLPVFGTVGGATAGAILGAEAAIPYAFGTASSVVEAGSTFGELLTEELNGQDMTKENVRAILENPEKLNSIRNKAIARGIVIGTVDALTGKLASGVGAKILTKSASKSATGAVTKAAVVRATAAGAGVEAVGGSLGEATARGIVGQEMDVSEIALEGIAELPGGVRSTIQARLAKPSYRVNGEKVDASQIDELINTMTPEQLAATDIKIKNDYTGKEFKIQDKIVTNSIKQEVKKANPDLNEPSLNAITQLEKELKGLEGNKTQTGKDKAAALKEQIKNIQENQIQEEAVVETAKAEGMSVNTSGTIDNLPLKEQDRLKRDALTQLTKELNPDGKENIVIDNEQITKRAFEIYSKEVENTSVKAPEKNVFYYYEAKGEKAPNEVPAGYTSMKKVENSEEVKLWNAQKPAEVAPAAEISVDEARVKRRVENTDLTQAEGSTYYDDVNPIKNGKIGDEVYFSDVDGKKYKTKIKEIVDGKVIFENGKTGDDVSSGTNITAEDAWFAKNHPELTLETKPIEAKPAIESPIELKEGEELVDVKQDKKGNTYTYVAETSEKDGVKTTKFKFNRSDKSSEQRNTAGVDADKVLDKYGYEIAADEIPEGAEIIEINEIREGEKTTGATVTFKNTETGNRSQGEIVLQPKAKEAKAAEAKPAAEVKAEEVAPTEAKTAEVKPAEALKDVESTAKALLNDIVRKEGFNGSENQKKFFKASNLVPEKIWAERPKDPTEAIAEAYHKAKAEGTNPELVKAVEELLAPEVKPAAEITPTATEAKVAIPDQHREEYDRIIKEYEKDLADSKENLKSEKERSFFSRSRSYIKENENDIKFYENQIKLLKENPIEFYKNWIKSVEETHNDSLKDKSKYDDGKTYKERVIENYGTTDFNVVEASFIEDFNKKIADYEAAQKTANENAKLKKPAEIKEIVAPKEDLTAGKGLFSEPVEHVIKTAEGYKKSKGITVDSGERITDIDVENSKKIADAYDKMESNPNDPEVKAAYNAMANETVDQFKYLIDNGYTVELYDGKTEPYKNSEEMLKDLRDNKHLYVFSTEEGFGDTPITEKDRQENPLLKDSGFTDKNGKKLLINDAFRFVHDIFGHGERGNSFGAKGEENAWDVHSRMYSPEARRAMTTETRGQNSWVNFNKGMRNEDGSIKKKGDKGYLSPTERPFADQKIGLLPEWVSKSIYETAKKPTETAISEKKIAEATKKLADKVREIKVSRPDIFSSGTPGSLAWDLGVEAVAKSIEITGDIAQAVSDGIEAIKKTDWYKGLDNDKKTVVEEEFRKKFNSLKENIDTAVETAKKKGFNDKDIADYLVGKGYTRAQATNAILKYNNVTAAKLRKEDSVFTKEGRNKIVTFLDQVKRRALSARSFLPKSVFLSKDKIESNIKAEAKKASYSVDEFNKLIKNYKGDVEVLHNEFDKYLRGDQTAVLPNEFKAVAGKMRNHIDNLSQMLLRTGAVSVSQAETIAKNLGQYVNRSYEVFDNKNWSKQVTDQMKEAARFDLRNMYRAEAESKAKQTGMDADIILEDFINKKIDELISGESAATFLGISKTGAKNLGIMKERLDIPLSIRKLMGEYTDASQNYARTVLKIATLAENARFLQSARESGMGVFFFNENDPNRPKEFNTKIAGEKSDTMSPLNGLYTTPEIAKAFAQKIGTGDAIEAALGTELGPVVRSVYETYMKALSSVKWLKTIGSVATHAKNVTGNLWFMLANGYYNPKKYTEAFSVLKNSSKEDLRNKLDEYIRAGIIDQSAALGEIKAMFADADFETAIENRLKKNPFQKIKAGIKKVGQKMTKAYQLEDDFFKIISYENEKDRYSNASFGKSFDQLTAEEQNIVKDKASEITKNILPNYSRIPGLVKLLKAVPVTGTFVSFQAEAYRTAWNTVTLAANELKSSNNKVKAIGAKRLAGIASSQAAKFGLMALMGTVISGGDDEDDDDVLKKNTKLFVAPWSKDSDLVLVDYGNGKMSYIDFSASDPHGGIKKAYNSVMAGKDVTESFTNGLTQLLEPFMKEDMLLNVITDIKNNKNAYGGKLYNESDTDTNKINAIMDRVYKAFEPGTITTVKKVIGSDDVRNELAGQLTGYKISTVDVEKQLSFKMKDLKDKSDEAKRLYNSAFYKFEDGKITEEELNAAYDQANKSQKETYEKMMEYMKSASFFGIEDSIINDSMEGVGKGVINDLWYGETPDMKQKEKKLTDEEFRAKYGERLFERLLRARELSKKGAR
jgi:uncharacterized protein YwbE